MSDMWAFAGPGVMKGIGAGKVVFRPAPGTLRVGQPAFWISAYSGDPVISGTIRWQFWASPSSGRNRGAG